MSFHNITRTSLSLTGAALLLMSAPASSQSFNIDFGDNVTLGTPTSAYGAASGSAGFWNDCIGDMPLADISGAATGVSIALVGVDLGFPGERTHAEGVTMTWGGGFESIEKAMREVPSVTGGTVKSIPSTPVSR